jgi:sulfite reductase alpha subunit-like flavoprotein
MRRFWKLLLRKNLPSSILAGTNYAVFGLGDSGYVKYNVSWQQLFSHMGKGAGCIWQEWDSLQELHNTDKHVP